MDEKILGLSAIPTIKELLTKEIPEFIIIKATTSENPFGLTSIEVENHAIINLDKYYQGKQFIFLALTARDYSFNVPLLLRQTSLNVWGYFEVMGYLYHIATTRTNPNFSGTKSVTVESKLLSQTNYDKLNAYPVMPSNTDDIAYAMINGKWEGIASAGKNVVTYNPTTAATLQALESGRIPVGLTEEQLEKVRANIGEEIWEQLDQTQTLELAPDINPDYLQIEAAKQAFLKRKAAEAEEAESMELSNEEIEPVTPKKSKS